MAVRECERSVRCFPCADENPFANLSAEDPDLNIFLSVDFRRIPNPPHNNWTSNVCAAFCESSISQEDADDCARRKTLDCIVDPPPPNPDTPSWPTPIYCNQSSICQTDGQCYTMPSGTVCAFSALEANALAQSLCNHRVHNPQITSACSTTPPQDPSEEPCPMESGTAAPDSLEISSAVTWKSAQTINDPAWTVMGSVMRINTLDLPPGQYLIHNLDGHVRVVYGGSDPEITCTDFILLPYVGLGDTEGDIISFSSCNLGSGCSPPSSEDANRVLCNAERDSVFEEFGGNERLNGTGTCYFEIDTCSGLGCVDGDYTHTPANPQIFNLRQMTGLIPQPRKVAISNYAALISQFADPAAAASWNGEFPERTVYSSMTVQWAVTAVGAFGGAVLRWTDAHPTSANGKGWMLEIFSAGAILLWRGFRAIGSTPIGRFQKDSTSTPSGPACCDIADASEDVWYPGENPP